MVTIQDLLSFWCEDADAIEKIGGCLNTAKNLINLKYDLDAEVEMAKDGEWEIVIDYCPSEIEEEILAEATNYASENYPELFC